MALALLVYVGLLAAFSFGGFPTDMVSTSHWPTLIDKPVGEDGYYMLTVADNIATHGRILYNHGVPATGIQPLATLMFAALDWVVKLCGGGSIALIRSVLVLGALLFVLFAWGVSRAAAALAPAEHRRTSAGIGFLLTLCSYTLFRLFTYGLETGIYLLLLLLCFRITLRMAQEGRCGMPLALLLGLCGGLAGQARIDFGIVFAVLLGTLLLYRWMRWGEALVSGTLALVVVAPWFLFVHSISGSWLPTSGKAESTLVAGATFMQRAGAMALGVAGEVMPWCYGVVSTETTIVAVLSAALVTWCILSKGGLKRIVASVYLSPHGRMWLVCLGVLLPTYLLLFNATHFYYRYMAPLAVLTLPASAVVLARFATVRRNLAFIAVLLCACFVSWTAGALHSGRLGNSQTLAAGYIHRYFPDARVGAFQSGVVGFFNPNVENLDGKLNGGALVAAAHHQLPQFIDKEHIDVLVDWPSVFRANLPADYLRRWKPCPIPIDGGGESVCLLRKTATSQEERSAMDQRF